MDVEGIDCFAPASLEVVEFDLQAAVFMSVVSENKSAVAAEYGGREDVVGARDYGREVHHSSYDTALCAKVHLRLLEAGLRCQACCQRQEQYDEGMSFHRVAIVFIGCC